MNDMDLVELFFIKTKIYPQSVLYFKLYDKNFISLAIEIVKVN